MQKEAIIFFGLSSNKVSAGKDELFRWYASSKETYQTINSPDCPYLSIFILNISLDLALFLYLAI